ncbi:hypothetical protein VPH35_125159 [Triticum aestivum]
MWETTKPLATRVPAGPPLSVPFSPPIVHPSSSTSVFVAFPSPIFTVYTERASPILRLLSKLLPILVAEPLPTSSPRSVAAVLLWPDATGVGDACNLQSYNHQRQKLQPVLPKAATSHKKSFDPLVKSFGR